MLMLIYLLCNSQHKYRYICCHAAEKASCRLQQCESGFFWCCSRARR